MRPGSTPRAGTPVPRSADVNGDGRPDLFVAGYADTNAPIPSSTAGFPANHVGVRDRLYLNQGPDAKGRSRFREVGKRAGLEATHLDHGLGAVFTDVNADGRLDLYVANDLDPNRLYLNVARPGRAARFPFPGARTARGHRRPERRHGHRRCGLQPRRARRPVRDQLPAAAARDLPQRGAQGRRGLVHRCASGLRRRPRQELHRLGSVVGRPRSRRQPRPRAGERRDPGREPEEGCAADPGAPEPHRGGSFGRVRGCRRYRRPTRR